MNSEALAPSLRPTDSHVSDKSGDRERKTGTDGASRGPQDRNATGQRSREQPARQEQVWRDQQRAELAQGRADVWSGQQRTDLSQRRPQLSPDTARQLDHDAFARQQGALRERSFNRGAIAAGGGGRAGRR